MDTIPFHGDTPDAPQRLRMACLCPDECHEDWVLRMVISLVFSLCQRRHRRRNKASPAAKVQPLRGARLKALLALDFCLCILGRSWNTSRREFQRDRSCKSPDSQYATTDMCSSTPAVRCRRNEGTCTRHHAHKYLWQGIHCQVICTKRPYLLPADGTAFRSEPWIIWPVSRGCITVTRTVNEKQ